MTAKGKYAACYHSAIESEERLRFTIDTNRHLWPTLCKVPTMNKRWLQAFAKGHLKHPSAYKYLALVNALKMTEESSR